MRFIIQSLLNVVLVFPSPFSPREALVQSIRMAAGEKVKVGFEGDCVICESGDPAELASTLAALFGANRIAVASKVSRQYSDISGAIVDVGSKAVMPGQKY